MAIRLDSGRTERRQIKFSSLSRLPRTRCIARDNQKMPNCTFFDYEKAYDKVWRDGLLHKMVELGIPWRFAKYTRHFLSGRCTSVEVNGEKSDQFRLNEGLPQGSCISPLLFLIFINDISSELHPDTLVSLFADDTAIWIQAGGDQKEDRDRMQKEMEKIFEWAERWKMKINEGKTKTLIISTKSSDYNWDPKFELNGKAVEPKTDYKFLGIKVDNGLRFTEAVADTVKNCTKRVNIMKCLASKDWGQSLESQRTTYISYIRSCLQYASSSWWPWISDTSKEKLERVQNAGLRAAAGLSKSCPVDFLRLETDIEPLSARMDKNDQILRDKYDRLPQEDHRRKMTDKKATVRLKTRKGWRFHTESQETKREIVRAEDLPKPWETFSNVRVEKVELEKKKEAYSKEQLKAISTAKISSYIVNYRIFTDGSTDGKQTNGGAGTYVEDAAGR